jgi:inhibitor of KinA
LARRTTKREPGAKTFRAIIRAMPKSKPGSARFEPASDQSLLVYLGDQITPQTHDRVRKLLTLLEAEPLLGVRNLHPAYCSVLVTFDARKTNHDKLTTALKFQVNKLTKVRVSPPRHLEIPVCYGGDLGPDLAEVSKLHGITEKRAIELHSSQEYLVYFLGFVPGFAYLGNLPDALVTPRLPTPRPKVPAGSVAIAANHTGVYPFTTPGGWRLLGRTPLRMFRSDQKTLSFLSIGDRVRFTPISRGRFAELENACP